MSLCHDHDHCIDEALARAQAICREKGVRLTPQREQVLSLIWQSHRPLGAYALIEALAKLTGKSIAPPTVYRALEFLMELGLIHRINSLNAFLGCPAPESHRVEANAHYFLICEKCHETQEFVDTQINTNIAEQAAKNAFVAQQKWLEVTGLCKQCQA